MRISSGDEMPWSLGWAENCLWAANNLGLFKLDPKTGEVLAEFPNPGTRPWGMTFDGEHLWVNDFTELELLKVSPETGEVLSRFSYADVFPEALTGLAWDGENLCLTGWGDVSGIVKFDIQGNFVQRIETSRWVGCGLTFDGENFWAPGGDGWIYKINQKGEVLGRISAGSSIGTWDLAWDGEHLWTGERTYEVWADNKIFEMEIPR
jgi:glutamine cyclotransferase